MFYVQSGQVKLAVVSAGGKEAVIAVFVAGDFFLARDAWRVDHLFNSSEKRRARIAEMVGTTRSRVNLFLNKFRKLGFIEYNGRIKINRSLLSVVLRG